MAAWQEAAAAPAREKKAAAERLENAYGDWDAVIGAIDETRKKLRVVGVVAVGCGDAGRPPGRGSANFHRSAQALPATRHLKTLPSP